jgi:hypothetical protein
VHAAGVEHAADVFDEHAPGSALDDEPAGGGPEVTIVGLPDLRSCLAVRLAWDARKKHVHASTKTSARDGSGICPNRRCSQGSRRKRFHQVGDGDGFPLHVQHWANARNCKLDGEIKGAGAGAEADGVQISLGGM